MQSENIYIDAIFEEESPKIGASKPILITASNSKQYLLKNNIVKYDGDDSYHKQDAEFFQESLVSNIATRLNIPSPNYIEITIDKETLETFPNLRWVYQFHVGKYFATERITNTENDLAKIWELATQHEQPYAITKWHKLFNSITNRHDFAAIICLDFFTLNFDRFTNGGNLLFQKQNSGKIILSIDYGFCFTNPFWAISNPSKAEILRSNDIHSNKIDSLQYSANLAQQFLYKSSRFGQYRWKYGIVFDALQRELQFEDCNPFAKIVFAIESLTNQDIYEMIEDIPNEWVVGASIQKEAYASFLIRQRGLLRGFIEYNLNQNIFTNYSGGDLTWETGKNTSSL